MMDSPMDLGLGMGHPMGGMPGRGGPMFGRGGMPGRGMPGRGGPMAEQQAWMMMKRRRMLEMQQEAGMNGMGPGGVRGAPGGGRFGALGGAMGPRPPAPGRAGFLGKQQQQHAIQQQYRNGGPGPPPDAKTMSLINEAVTPQAILHLWADESRPWAEGHLGQGLLRFAQLVEEICPDDTQEVRRALPCFIVKHLSRFTILRSCSSGIICTEP
jgi:hypothetical protein